MKYVITLFRFLYEFQTNCSIKFRCNCRM